MLVQPDSILPSFLIYKSGINKVQQWKDIIKQECTTEPILTKFTPKSCQQQTNKTKLSHYLYVSQNFSYGK